MEKKSVDADVLVLNAIGPGFTGESVRKAGIGGSELEITQIAEALVARGHTVTVANGVASESTVYGVKYVPYAAFKGGAYTTMYIERGTPIPPGANISCDHIVVRATDIMCAHYDVHRKLVEGGNVPVVCVSEWQARGFRQSITGCKTVVIPPILGITPKTECVPGRFV